LKNLELFKNILKENCPEVCLDGLTMSEDLTLKGDLGLDSIALLSMIVGVENKLQITLDDNQLSSDVTLGEIDQLIKNALKEKELSIRG